MHHPLLDVGHLSDSERNLFYYLLAEAVLKSLKYLAAPESDDIIEPDMAADRDEERSFHEA